MKQLLKTILPQSAVESIRLRRDQLFHRHAQESYAQEGEDLVLERYFGDRPVGFYVDIGAHHPMMYSNTYRFYRKGWRGLNIDANPGCMKRFQSIRPRDINVEAGVSSDQQTLTYYIFNKHPFNTFDRELALERACDKYFIVNEVPVPVFPLSQLLDQYLPSDTEIDFLTVDVEGYDFKVLQSNDWKRYRPEFILAEVLESDLESSRDSSVAQLLGEKGYLQVAKTMNTVVFRRRDSLQS